MDAADNYYLRTDETGAAGDRPHIRHTGTPSRFATSSASGSGTG